MSEYDLYAPRQLSLIVLMLTVHLALPTPQVSYLLVIKGHEC